MRELITTIAELFGFLTIVGGFVLLGLWASGVLLAVTLGAFSFGVVLILIGWLVGRRT